MKVFKFGGASIKNANAVNNMIDIVRNYTSGQLLVVVSAMGKSTNALELLYKNGVDGIDCSKGLSALCTYHFDIIDALQIQKTNDPKTTIKILLNDLKNDLNQFHLFDSKEAYYDKIVSYGERMSSRIIEAALNNALIKTQYIDAKEYVITDGVYKEAKVNWPVTNEIIKGLFPILEKYVVITQGFIGGSPNGSYTTLGREGSDFSAAIFATGLDAESVTIWKDVPGILNADPKIIKNAIKYERLNYRDASEMTYYGASVIHPKTIKPLANKGIPLWVKSFEKPSELGTLINSEPSSHNIPAIIYKENQHLIVFRVKDFTFINESHLSILFHMLDQLNIKINMMQNSAISFSICVDYHTEKGKNLVEALKNDFTIVEYLHLSLITIKNHDEAVIKSVSDQKAIILEQKTIDNFQIVVRS